MNLKKILKTKLNFCLTLTAFMLVSLTANAQKTIAISGTVIDDKGITMPGVNVVEQGTKNGVSTDVDGKYKINVADKKSVLVFSSIGYETFKQAVGNQKTLNIVLLSGASTNLKDVVIDVGYGTTKKVDLTGSVATVSGADLAKKSMSNVAETLTGKIAGVKVSSSEGSPDSDIQIRVRGGGSVTQDASPLMIVDGFPVTTISDISPSDIENISILKDASSTAIYGSRGSNGVIIVTTKKGGKDGGKVSISLNRFYGFKSIAKTYDVLNPQEFANWQYEFGLLNGKTMSTYYDTPFGGSWYPTQFQGVKGTDWQKDIYGQNGVTQSTDFGVRGGTDKLNYNFNFARFDEQAIMKGSNYNRDNLSLNLRSKTNDKVDLSFTIRYSDTQVEGSGANDQKEVSSQDARFRHAVGYTPIDLVGITSDDTDDLTNIYYISPNVAVEDNNRYQNRKNYNMSTSFQWKMTNNLTFKTELGLDNYFITDDRFYGRSTYYASNNVDVAYVKLPSLISNDRKDVKFRNANTLNYDFKKYFGDKHKLKILVGEETISLKSQQKTSIIQGFPKTFTFDNTINISAIGHPVNVANVISPEDNLLSFFARVNYDYNGRYLFTATYRADGSSKFIPSNRWGFFPSAAFAWKMSSENFLKDVSWLKLLKLRISYGEAGNNNIPTGQTFQQFQAYATPWINNVPTYLAPIKEYQNPNLKWETTITQNVGLDYELFKGRISGSVEAYKNITQDLLVKFPIPGTGYDYQYRNMGEVQNTGIETSLNLVAIQKENYGLDFNFNIGFNKNRINSLGVMNNFKDSTGWASTDIGADFIANVGEPVGQMYGFVSAGRYEVSDFDFVGGVYTLKTGVATDIGIIGTVRPGSMKLADLNGDLVINDLDKKVIGNANPVHTGGFVIDANAYGFDMSANFNWTYGNDIYNADKIHTTTSLDRYSYRNLNTTAGEGVRWNNLDPITGSLVTNPTQLAAMNESTTLWSPSMARYVFSDWAVEDGSFLRLNTLSLGYSFKKDVAAKINASKLRLYVTANNVFVWTKYSGLDPEVSTRRGTPLTPGVDYSAYPRSRQFVFGINLNF